jgi:MOSC domain-containing protein YiiM/ferredoxin-NADP reductase
LVSVNVGLPQDVPWRGHTVYTAVFKRPVDGPCLVGRTNLSGDGQGDLGGHGGVHRAVLAYQLDSYRHWEQHFGRQDLMPGHFGENLTIDGLPDEEVCIGDRYRIGDVLLEVSQPRVTCYRVGLRLGEPEMASLMVAHGRPGFYLRVLAEGNVQAGDEIDKVASGPEGMTVAEASALLYLPGHEPSELRRALRIPALSPGWQWSFQALLDQPAPSGTGNPGLNEIGRAPAPAWPGFRTLIVSGIKSETDTVVSISFSTPDRSPLPAALPGQFITLRLRPGAAAPPIIRSYSLSGPPRVGAYRISVKLEPHGAASQYLHQSATTGQLFDVAAPRGTFTLDTAAETPAALISAGVGATPMVAMLHALVDSKSVRPIWWLHSARNRAEHCFAVEAGELLARLPNAHRRIYYSAPAATDRRGLDFDNVGHMSASALDQRGLVPRPRSTCAGRRAS